MRSRRYRLVRTGIGAAVVALVAVAVVSSRGGDETPSAGRVPAKPSASRPAKPPAVGGSGVYAAASAGRLSAQARGARSLVYVPDSQGDDVRVIDPRTFKVVDRFDVGREPQHVVPSYDLKTLWVNDDQSNDLVPIDPRTGRRGASVKVDDPYNLYFTPDGRHALVMAERLRRIDVRDPCTMRLQGSIPVPCAGVNHADFTRDGAWMLASCEFSGKLLVIPRTLDRVVKVIDLNGTRTPGATDPATAKAGGGPAKGLVRDASAMPQDVRLTDDGSTFVVADMLRNGVWVVDVATQKVVTFVPTGKGAHGIYPSRDARRLFVSNRDGASISVLDARGRKVIARWPLPPGSSPDMGGVSVDGRQLWLSGRYDGVVYVVDSANGKVLHTIKVGAGPHGLLVWPQPGRYSLGHTGNMR